MSKVLVAGPWLGEFGWELFMWQARIRYLHFSGDFEKIVCVIRNGHEFLYNDYMPDFAFLNIDGEKNGWKLNEKKPEIPQLIKAELKHRYGEYSTVEPGCQFDYKAQKFISFSSKSKEKKYDLVFHCRSTDKLNTGYRNWELEKWNELRSYFVGLKIACVGSKEESISIDGTDDLRGISLKELAAVLSESRLLVGPSSGTMHFGSLCECNHLVFTDQKISFEGYYTNRYRYNIGWNPLGTKAIVLDEEGWRPSVQTVIKYIEKEL